MNHEFMEALDELVVDRGIDKEILIDTIEQALLTAYKKNFGSAQNVRVEFDRDKGDIKVFSQRVVVDESDLYDTFLEIELADAREINPNYELGDIIEHEVTPKNFGRIAAQTAKQVVVQRIREAEREIVYNEFIEKENEIVTGEVARANKNIVYVNLGRIEGIMTQSEQIPFENYRAGQKIKFYILEVKKTNKGPQIVVSRSHPGLVKRLFEEEVPEIYEGIVQIKSVAREAGSRTKMAVRSIDEKIDPIGACVGPKGLRVKNIVDELGDEKIDIIKYSEDPAEFISAALSPSKVVRVDINEDEKSALVIVPDYQLSLAIGKEGQNARLAAKLTNWKIDIKSESQAEQEMLNLENFKEIEDEDVEAEFIKQEELDTSDDNFSEKE
ncbi:TPA: transcription termination/antitermination protein NusA [Clostridioides difficile]|nr:transcription termination/antitermination protein NusA [Clostridioides difficile]